MISKCALTDCNNQFEKRSVKKYCSPECCNLSAKRNRVEKMKANREKALASYKPLVVVKPKYPEVIVPLYMFFMDLGPRRCIVQIMERVDIHPLEVIHTKRVNGDGEYRGYKTNGYTLGSLHIAINRYQKRYSESLHNGMREPIKTLISLYNDARKKLDKGKK